MKAVRAPRLAPWASERHKREVRKYAVKALLHGEADAEWGDCPNLRFGFLAGGESGTNRRAVRCDEELWRSGLQFDFGAAIPVAFAL